MLLERFNLFKVVMVYGEYAQHPAVAYCKLLVENLHPSLNKVYLFNSGTEANEGSLKTFRRLTGKNQMISCDKG